MNNKWVTEWRNWLEHDKELALGTCNLYERTIELLQGDTAAKGPVEDLHKKDLLAWLISKSPSTSSYGNRVIALRSFYGYLFRRGYRKDDPSITLNIPPRPPIVREPVRDLETKLQELDQLDQKVERRVGESRDMAVFLAETGIRISDACALSLKPPVPKAIAIPRRRRAEEVFELTDKARRALDRLGGRFGIGPRALQRRFEKVGFHPDQLRHWHRVQRELKTILPSPELSLLKDPSRMGVDDATSHAETPAEKAMRDDPLVTVGRFLRLAEDVTAALVREALRSGKTWDEIANTLLIPETVAKQRFAV